MVSEHQYKHNIRK